MISNPKVGALGNFLMMLYLVARSIRPGLVMHMNCGFMCISTLAVRMEGEGGWWDVGCTIRRCAKGDGVLSPDTQLAKVAHKAHVGQRFDDILNVYHAVQGSIRLS